MWELARVQEKKACICHRHSSFCGEREENETFLNLFLAVFNVSLSLLQATNSHTNEVVAVKKMSYSGKQTNEVRGIKANCAFRSCGSSGGNLSREMSCSSGLTPTEQLLMQELLLPSMGILEVWGEKMSLCRFGQTVQFKKWVGIQNAWMELGSEIILLKRNKVCVKGTLATSLLGIYQIAKTC